MRHRPRGAVGGRAVRRSARAEDQLHRQLSDRRTDHAVAGVKKLSLELGASCPVVVLPDADIELAASAIAVGGYTNAGQVCISVQRVVADRRVVGDLLDALVPKVQAIKVGDPSEPDTALGVTDLRARRGPRRSGAPRGLREWRPDRHRWRARRLRADAGDRGRRGPESPLSQDELFGPAVAVSTASDVDQAIELANGPGTGSGPASSPGICPTRFVSRARSIPATST